MLSQLPVMDDQAVRQALAQVQPKKIVEALRSAFKGLASESSVAPKPIITDYPDGNGDSMFYPGVLWDSDLVGVKVSPYVPARSTKGLNPVTAYTLLLSARTGEPVLLCDSMALTAARTAGTTALALEYLASPSAKRLAVIGSSTLATEHLRFMTAVSSWEVINIYSPALSNPGSPNHAARKASVDQVRTAMPVTIAPSIQEAVKDADVVLCCTSASEPLLDLEWLSPHAVITSITTDGGQAHEIAPADLAKLNVFCDYKGSAPTKAYEFKTAAADFGWSVDSVVGDLGELINNSITLPTSGRRYFRSCGLGIEDLAIAGLLRA